MSAATVSPFWSATEMLVALRDGQISAVELLELCLQQIERHNPRVNAVVIPDYERARQAAREADANRGRGGDGRLLGVPITVKDALDVQGLPTTAGLPERAQALAAGDSPVVARLRAVGAIILGKTNLPPGAGDFQSDNGLFGRTNNPWDLTRTPGGSTGGGAASVAAGFSAVDIGGDNGGSIRGPAAFCGIFGHLPSETAWPRHGTFSQPEPNPVLTVEVQGPLARSARDLELVLDSAAGPDTAESVAWDIHLPPARHERLEDFRVAFCPPIPWMPVDAELSSALEELAGRLAGRGVTVGVAQPRLFGDGRAHARLFMQIMGARFQPATGAGEPPDVVAASGGEPDEFADAFARGWRAGAGTYIAWHAEREHYRAAYREFFHDWDVLLAPVASTLAFPHIPYTTPMRERWLEVNGERVSYGRRWVYASLANLASQPATAFPLGISRAGLPIGVQAIGPYLEDRTPLRFAELVSREFATYQPPPGFQ